MMYASHANASGCITCVRSGKSPAARIFEPSSDSIEKHEVDLEDFTLDEKKWCCSSPCSKGRCCMRNTLRWGRPRCNELMNCCGRIPFATIVFVLMMFIGMGLVIESFDALSFRNCYGGAAMGIGLCYLLITLLFATLTTGNTRKRCFGRKSCCNGFTLCLYRLHFIESYVTTIANTLFVLVAAVLLMPLYVGGDTSALMSRCEDICESIEFGEWRNSERFPYGTRTRPLEYVLSAIKYQAKWGLEDKLEVLAEDRAWFFFVGCLLFVFAQAHLTIIMHSNIKLASQLRNLEEDELVQAVQLIDDPKLHSVVDIRSTSLDV